jgi:hypothetical protein
LTNETSAGEVGGVPRRGAVKRAEMKAAIARDLDHMPSGAPGSAQNRLRTVYRVTRTRHLVTDPVPLRLITLEESIAVVQVRIPRFEPEYDQYYFET